MRFLALAKYIPFRFGLLSLALLGLLFSATAPVAQAQDNAHVYLPAIQGPAPYELYGTVTYQGQQIAGITVELWRYSEVDPVLTATTVTGSDGSYRFVNVPELARPKCMQPVSTTTRMGS